jgi:hypothetical protein
VDEHTIVALDEEFGNVSVCPGGVVHLNLRYCSLKFMPSDFTRLANLIQKARLNIEDDSRPPVGKPRLQVISSKTSDEGSPDSET